MVIAAITFNRFFNDKSNFWHSFEKYSSPPWLWILGVVVLVLIIWSIVDQYTLRNFKYNSEYSLLFPSLVVWLFSFHVTDMNYDMLVVTLFLVVFVGLWMMFQHKESKITLLGAGLAVGIVVLKFPVLGILVGFGLSSLCIWNPNPLRNSLILLLGSVLPAYYQVAYHQIILKDLPQIPSLNHPEIWLVNHPYHEIPWHLILVLGAAILGLCLQFPLFGSFSRNRRHINLQWIWLLVCLIPVFVLAPTDPWCILAMLSPWGAWFISTFLQWKNGTWTQDLFVAIWLGLYLWGY
jgi:hypothetical protein